MIYFAAIFVLQHTDQTRKKGAEKEKYKEERVDRPYP